MPNTYTTAELAERLDTTPKKLRRFLRSEQIGPVGKGNRYAIEARYFRSLKKNFSNWNAQHTRKSAA